MNKGFSVALLSVGIALLSACSSTPEQNTTRTAEPVKKEEPTRVAHILFFEHDSAAAPEAAAGWDCAVRKLLKAFSLNKVLMPNS